MSVRNALRALAAAGLLASAACAPVFSTSDYAGLSPVSFTPDASHSVVVGRR